MTSRWWISLLGAVAIAWVGGLVWFVSLVPEGSETANQPTDAIVVLTGGSLRVENGLSLLAEGKAKKLFVSGVYRRTDVKALLRTSNQEPKWLACCIELGHEADNTHGNAAETAAWMRAEHFHSLRLVTASYHMPRSLLEFSRAMPEMRIVPHPVFPQVARRPWWLSPHSAMLIVAEYMKYLFALTSIQSLAPAP
ncbi:MAG TPA: YdcF family protein [Stellaceae bacterium]|jgi:uncharacterized SAM-binding protein YcdF (DUF218 family)|nr:YdcF family protein [Stellaceae bacterium]